MSKTYELRWRGPCDMSGYGTACIGYAIGLSKGGLRLRLVDKSMSINLAGKGMDDHVKQQLAELQEVPITKSAPTVQHQVADKMQPSKASDLNIGYTIFEMTTVPTHWVKNCNLMDQIWTGSEYSRQAFIKSGVNENRIHVIPHILDLDRYNSKVTPIDLPNKAAFNFVSVFDFQERKAWRELLTAYARAFTAKDDVCLWLKIYQHSFEKEDQIALIAKLYQFLHDIGIQNPPRIEVCPFDLPYSVMPRFYAAFDCYVSISREGFGLPYAEAAACGLTIIGPEVGGVREFLTEENSYLVEYVGDRPISNEMLEINPTFTNLQWATHSVEHLEHQFRHVIENTDEAAKKGRLVQQTVQERLHYSVIAEKVKGLLDK